MRGQDHFAPRFEPLPDGDRCGRARRREDDERFADDVRSAVGVRHADLKSVDVHRARGDVPDDDAARVRDDVAGLRHATALLRDAESQHLHRARLLFCDERAAADEERLVELDVGREPSRCGRDRARAGQLVPVKRKACLGPRRVARAKSARLHAEVGAGREDRFPERRRAIGMHEEFVAEVLAGVAGARDDDGDARQLRFPQVRAPDRREATRGLRVCRETLQRRERRGPLQRESSFLSTTEQEHVTKFAFELNR